MSTAWTDPRFQLACLCMLDVGGIPGRPDATSVAFLLDGARHGLVAWLPPGREFDACSALTQRVQAEAGGALALVVVGGDASHTPFVEALSQRGQAVPAVGVAHLTHDGTLTAFHLDGAVHARLRARLAEGAPTRTAEAMVALLDDARAQGQPRIAALQQFQRTMQSSRPVATWALLAANVAMFGLQSMWGDGTVAALVRMGACVDARVRDGEAWRLLSYASLHAGFQHLLFNMVSLASLGAFCERLLGRGRFLAVYVLAALGGGVAAVATSRASVMVGASGAICGLIGVSAAIALRPGDLLPTDLRAAFQRNVGGNVALLAMTSLLPSVSLAAHAGGAAVGFALMLPDALRPRRAEADAAWARAVGYALVAAMLLSSAVALRAGHPWETPRSQLESALE